MKSSLQLIIERTNELTEKKLSDIQNDLLEVANHLLSNICVQVRLDEASEPAKAEEVDNETPDHSLGQPVEVAIYDPKAKSVLLGWQKCRVIGVIKSPLVYGRHIWLYKTTIGTFREPNIRAFVE